MLPGDCSKQVIDQGKQLSSYSSGSSKVRLSLRTLIHGEPSLVVSAPDSVSVNQLKVALGLRRGIDTRNQTLALLRDGKEFVKMDDVRSLDSYELADGDRVYLTPAMRTGPGPANMAPKSALVQLAEQTSGDMLKIMGERVQQDHCCGGGCMVLIRRRGGQKIEESAHDRMIDGHARDRMIDGQGYDRLIGGQDCEPLMEEHVRAPVVEGQSSLPPADTVESKAVEKPVSLDDCTISHKSLSISEDFLETTAPTVETFPEATSVSASPSNPLASIDSPSSVSIDSVGPRYADQSICDVCRDEALYKKNGICPVCEGRFCAKHIARCRHQCKRMHRCTRCRRLIIRPIDSTVQNPVCWKHTTVPFLGDDFSAVEESFHASQCCQQQ